MKWLQTNPFYGCESFLLLSCNFSLCEVQKTFDTEIIELRENDCIPTIVIHYFHLQEGHFSCFLHEQMELIDLLPHQRGNRVTAGNDALRLSENLKMKHCDYE